ncbi:winged helix DNA-binding protein [Pseudonocardia hierapolitana]|uniref:Winged helix DNA-binding protein n=1 Tax=Pseudonocardia hierapolitana TaxID=1128676 RepID=A0A561SH63_9PSEU|nr:winged helix DNA-binding domain-containing protein [Pseudonocardia hierapolitana]TWF74205.1 winged helix DNA-binding protein [Pseudonocardia hierapolitana]
MAERVLSTRELNRAVLARQLLLERAALSPEQAVEQVAGLQTQYAPSGYIGLWSRLAGFRRHALTEALLAGRVVQAWAMRCTIHMVSPADYWPFTEAVRQARREWWRRAHRAVGPVDMPAIAAAVRSHLADGPRKQAEIQRQLAAAGHPREVWPGVQLWVDLVRVPPAGTWNTPRAHVYGLAEHTVSVPEPAPSEQCATEFLVARYLRGFGPASPGDIASFCGWSITATRAVLARMQLCRYRTEAGGELVDVPGGPLPPADTPAPVRFLGQWDANLLVHARRAQILPEEHRPRVFARNIPQSVPTFLVDGQVAGTWRYIDGEVRCEPFQPLARDVAPEVEAEAARLATFHVE